MQCDRCQASRDNGYQHCTAPEECIEVIRGLRNSLFFGVGDRYISQLVTVILGNVAGRVGYGITFSALCLTDLILDRVTIFILDWQTIECRSPVIVRTQNNLFNRFFIAVDNPIQSYLDGFKRMLSVSVEELLDYG